MAETEKIESDTMVVPNRQRLFIRYLLTDTLGRIADHKITRLE